MRPQRRGLLLQRLAREFTHYQACLMPYGGFELGDGSMVLSRHARLWNEQPGPADGTPGAGLWRYLHPVYFRDGQQRSLPRCGRR